MLNWFISLSMLAAVALCSPPARAIDGEILLTHARALAGGITPGDAKGYPISITRTGTYKLASNLAPTSGKIGIHVAAHDVTIDFAGYRLFGDYIATIGIYAPYNSVWVRNGLISAFKSHGILITGPFGIVENMRIVANSGNGIYALGPNIRHFTVRNSAIVENGGFGIHAAGPGPVLIEGSMVNGNGRLGIVASRAHVSGNTIADNHSDGVEVGEAGTVLGNTIIGNAGRGLFAGSLVGVGNNSFSDNNGAGAELSGGFPLHPNSCNGGACP